MRYFLVDVSLILLLVSCFYEIAYYKRKRFEFDEKCNKFFIVSRALGIAGITMLVLGSIFIAFSI